MSEEPFFPRYFNDDFFRTALNMSYGSIWYNYWRQTDPIGSKLSGHNATTHGDGPQVQDIDITELANEETRGHCEYWQDDRIRRDVEAYFAFFGLVKKWHDEFNDLTRQQDPPITNKTVRMMQSDKATISFECGGEPFTHTISYRPNGSNGKDGSTGKVGSRSRERSTPAMEIIGCGRRQQTSSWKPSASLPQATAGNAG